MATPKKFSALAAQQKADMRDQIRGYRVLSGFLYEEENSGQIQVTVLENTINSGIAWNYYDNGFIYCYLPGSNNFFNPQKTFVFLGQKLDTLSEGYAINFCSSVQPSQIDIWAYRADNGAMVKNLFQNIPFEIRVYL